MSYYKTWTADVSKLTREQIKKKLWDEIGLKADVRTRGVDITDEAIQAAELGTKHQEQVLGGGFNREKSRKVLPACFYLPYGLKVRFVWNKNSLYKIVLDNKKPTLVYNGEKIAEITYSERPRYYSQLSSDGTPLYLIGDGSFYDRHIFITYSNECTYKEKGEDCLFCNINYNSKLYSEKYGTYWRTPKVIGEAVKAAFEEGVADHLTISGGVVAERRELDYFVDSGEEIQKVLGTDKFNGTAVITAPLDFKNIDKLKESGFRTIGLNLELWNKDFYKAVCPGKANNSGGWDNWVKALEYAAKAFGFGRVRSNFVAGIEPKSNTIDGIEYLSSKGVVCSFNIWSPNVGSAFEGHRSPETSWYLDLGEKVAEIWKKNGFTFDKIHDATAGDYRLPSDIFRTENEVFDIYSEAIN